MVGTDDADKQRASQLPAPRTIAPSREDVLANLAFFFGDPVVPERLRDYSEHHAMCAPAAGAAQPRRRPAPPNPAAQPRRLRAQDLPLSRRGAQTPGPALGRASARPLRTEHSSAPLPSRPCKTHPRPLPRMCKLEQYYGQNTSAPPLLVPAPAPRLSPLPSVPALP